MSYDKAPTEGDGKFGIPTVILNCDNCKRERCITREREERLEDCADWQSQEYIDLKKDMEKLEIFKNKEKDEYLSMSKEQFIVTLQEEHYRDWKILYETIAQREKEGIIKQLKLMAKAWDCAHLSDNSIWNKALTQCGQALETYIKKLEGQ